MDRFRRAAFLLLLGLCSAPQARAQFFGLATPADGSRVYFTTPLRERRTWQPAWGKLFTVDARGVRLREARSYQVPIPPPPGIAVGFALAQPTNAYDLQAASVSADGSVVAVTGWRDCLAGGNYCYKIENYLTTITAGGKSAEYGGRLQLSANGQWAFGASSHNSVGDFPYYAYLLNLTTGTMTSVLQGNSASISSAGRVVSNNGAAVMVYSGALAIVTHAGTKRIDPAPGETISAPVIDAAGQTVVYGKWSCAPGIYFCTAPGERTLWVLGALTGNTRQLAADGDLPSLSDDGSSVLYTAYRSGKPQLRMVRTDGTGDRPLTNDPAGIASAVLSGDGGTAWAVTRGGMLIRVDTNTGAVDTVIPRTPIYGAPAIPKGPFAPPVFFTPGSTVTIPGAGLSSGIVTAAEPLPYLLANVSVTIGGRPAPIVRVAPDGVTVQAPLDVAQPAQPYLSVPYRIDVGSESVFETQDGDHSFAYFLRPEFLTAADEIVSAHMDWSAVVTSKAPARPGEQLHSFGVGWGVTATDESFAQYVNGQAPLASPLACVTDAGTPVAIDYQGLAPGATSVYQMDWRVPSDAKPGTLKLTCGIPSGLSFSGLIPVGAPAP